MGMFSFLGEPALTRNAANQIVEKYSPGRDPMSFLFLHAEDAEKTLSAEIMSFSMFSPSRVFWVGTIEKAPAPLLEFLLSFVKEDGHESPHTLILTGEGLPKTGPVRKLKAALKKHAALQEFPLSKVNSSEYLGMLCTKNDLQLSKRARHLLLQKVGKDLLSLENEVQKLSCFAQGETITDRDVEELSATIAEASIWDLTDALVSKDAGKAIATLYQMLEEGRAPHQLLSTISWQIRQLIELQESVQKKRATPNSWRRIPQRKRQSAIRTLKRSPIKPKEMFASLQRVNRLFNSSRAGDRRNLELFVLELCAQ